MLTLTLRQLNEKLPVWITTRLSIALIGPPGTGKTYNSRAIAEALGLSVEVLDGGQENEWKGLFPYRTPTGVIEKGRALLADKGVLIVDEFNRVPPELKTSFQLLASEKIVPWPEGGVRKIDVAIIATANDSDLGVEEAGRAELDRYDLIVRLEPTADEVAEIVVKNSGVRLEIAKAIYEFVVELRTRLDVKKFHAPEGIRMAESIAKLLKSNSLGATDVFKGAAERCFPLGRVGAEKTRAEFDSTVADIAGRFAGKLATLGAVTSARSSLPVSNAQPTFASLQDLKANLPKILDATVTTQALVLPNPFVSIMHVFTQAFGMGVTKHLMQALGWKRSEAERKGVKLHFGQNGKADSVEFRGVAKAEVEMFLNLLYV